MTLAAKAITFGYPNHTSPTTQVTIKCPEFADRSTVDRRDVMQESAAGELIVYQRGPARFLIEYTFEFLTDVESQNLANFFYQVVFGAALEFDLKVPNWGGDLVTIYAGTTLAGSAVTAGAGYTVGQQLVPDFIYYTGVTFESPSLTYEQTRDGWYSGSLTMRAKGKTL